ncbi:hypothetical protein Tco_1563184 [Tanacetum coccineum]
MGKMGSNEEIRRLSQEAEKQQVFAQKVQQQNMTLTSQIEMYKERVWILEAQSQLVRDRDIIRDLEKQRDKLELDVKDHKRQKEEYQKTQMIFKQTQRDEEEKYLNDIFQLQAKIKDLENVVCKMGKSTETLRLLTNEQKAFRDNLQNSGLGYNGPYVLSQAYAKIPKLYNAYELCNKSEQLHVFDSEETHEDAFKNFVPQKELSVKQKYFPSSSIPSVKIPNCKRASIFYTSPTEIEINDFCQDQVKPILNEMKVYLEFFQNLFQRDIKEMKDVFESTESELNELEKQNELLKDQLLEASLAKDIKNLVITSCVEIRNKDLHDEIDRISKESKDVSNESKTTDTVCNDAFGVTQELSKSIIELEKDFSKFEAKSIAFEIALQHNKILEKIEFFKKSPGEKQHLFENKTSVFQIKIDELEKVLTQQTKDFNAVKLELSNITAKFEAYFEKLKKTKVVLERKLARKVDDSKAEKDQFLKEMNHLRTQLENLKGKSVETKFDKSSILGKPPADKLFVNSQISKSWFTPKVDVQKDLSKPVTAQSLPKNEKDRLLK